MPSLTTQQDLREVQRLPFCYPNRGCVGMYRPKSDRPRSAARATDLEFPFPNKEKLDPFGN